MIGSNFVNFSSERSKDKQCRFISQTPFLTFIKGANISGGHCIYIQSWSKLLAPLVNMIKEGCENDSALLILLIFYLKTSQKSNLSLENKNLKWGEISL